MNIMRPYISFVIAARNDNFGGDFLSRLQTSLNSIYLLSEKYNLPAELIIVEWNPPINEARLKDVVSWPKGIKNLTTRIIEVPNEIHKQFKNSHKVPFFELSAKNVGIRRAKGKYILATNSDIIFSDHLIRYLAKQILSPDAFYRVDRYDIKVNLESNVNDMEKLLALCKNNVFRVNTMHGGMLVSRWERIKNNLFGKIRRFTFKKAKNKIEKIFLKRKRSEAIEAKNNEDRFKGIYLHDAGDFMMMSAERWNAFRGYPATGIDRGSDCYTTIMAHIAGLLQVVIPYPIYHIEHDRAEQLLRPTTVLENIPEFNRMIETDKPVIMNDENWGLGNIKLKETVIK